MNKESKQDKEMPWVLYFSSTFSLRKETEDKTRREGKVKQKRRRKRERQRERMKYEIRVEYFFGCEHTKKMKVTR